MLNVENGNVLIAAGFGLHPFMPFPEYKEIFDVNLWQIWQWNDEDHHICYRREYTYFDNTQLIIQLHFIARVLHVVDLSFTHIGSQKNTMELQEKAWSRILGKSLNLINVYSFVWGNFCVMKDEFGLPILRVTYQ